MGATMHEDRYGVVSQSLDVLSVDANLTAERDFTVIGLKPGDFVSVCKPTLSAGLGVVNARVKAADTLSITYVNATALAIDPGAETYLIFWFRPEAATSRVNV